MRFFPSGKTPSEKMKSKILLSVMILTGALLAGCATSDALNNLRIGMSKDQVISLLGKPDSTSAQANVEYLTYYLEVETPEGPGRDQPYLVRLVDGKVESYGRFAQLYDLYTRPVNGAPPAINELPLPMQAAISAPPAAPAAPDLATQLQKLKDLKDQGVLTDDEFQKAKAKLLSGQ
jgi:hypothetical protein